MAILKTDPHTEAGASVNQALVWLAKGSPADVARAATSLQAAAEAGCADAFAHLATLAGAGVGMPQSWPLALDHLLAAAEGGSASAQTQLKILAGAGAVPDADWRALRASVRVQEWTAPVEKRVLNASPRIVAIDDFLPRPACEGLIDLARGRLSPALVFGRDGVGPKASATRANTAFEIPFIDNTLVVQMVRLRLAATIGVPLGALEPSQILHYDVGEAFAEHHDYLYPDDPGRAAEIAAHGQRVATFLIYLNDDFDGGETEFPKLGLEHRGRAGSALYFANLGADGAGDPRTLHAGRAPVRGEKWLFSQWVRNRAVV